MDKSTPSRRRCRCEEESREAAALAHAAQFGLPHSPAAKMFRTAMEFLQEASRTREGTNRADNLETDNEMLGEENGGSTKEKDVAERKTLEAASGDLAPAGDLALAGDDQELAGVKNAAVQEKDMGVVAPADIGPIVSDEWSWLDDPNEAAFLKSRVLNFDAATAEGEITKREDFTEKYPKVHWYSLMESEWRSDYHEPSDMEKKAAIARFPRDNELRDAGHWYNRTRDMAWTKSGGKECAVCGFQGHVPRYCPSPRKWRLQFEGKFQRGSRDDSFIIPHRRGANWLQEQDVRSNPPAWLELMDEAARGGMGSQLTIAEKKEIVDRFPTLDDLLNKNHWYNKALGWAWDPKYGEQCATCGFQGHDPEHCPSPMRWRKELEEAEKMQQQKLEVPMINKKPLGLFVDHCAEGSRCREA